MNASIAINEKIMWLDIFDRSFPNYLLDDNVIEFIAWCQVDI